MSCETTFAATGCRRTLLDICRSLSCDLAADLESKKLSGRSITLKYKTAEFDLRTRTCPMLATPTRDSGTIASAACECLTSEMNNSAAGQPLTLRLLGVRMAHFGGGGAAAPKKVAQQQLTLDQMFGAAPPKRRRTVSPSPESYQGAPSDSVGSDPSTSRRPGECTESLGADVVGAASSSSSQPESSSPSVGGQFTCPVCLRWSTDDAEVQLNRHMDECLNQQTIQAMTERAPS